MALPPLVLDVHISTELQLVPEVPEAEAGEQEVAVDTEAYTVPLEGWFSWSLQILRTVINCGDFDFGCAGVHDGGRDGGELRPLARGLLLSESADDDE
jgi:hypothetical protein